MTTAARCSELVFSTLIFVVIQQGSGASSPPEMKAHTPQTQPVHFREFCEGNKKTPTSAMVLR